ncbi:sodium bile acid symporter family-domain-containing protein [Protomyces lactucae-debilis]|uniref:Sodium bile acid symporter family-domain-containing protein n=1 Tax=Protomyces lactucae-debilis TaxID=2754530 RepID=A0A1Y2FJY9_PROLT|nr:sodium bile acid symporter family-domain-containing protein [Protomyces lactucae-debilis]ORY84278.1 sodium bile acid symporter family-domain-containing protein [Protomyces lactucae-debilis]
MARSSSASSTAELEPRSESPTAVAPFKALSFLDQFLWLWIILAMAIGIILGRFVNDIQQKLDTSKLIGVSAPIAVGLLVMMYPILCKVQYERLHHILRAKGIWRQIAFSVVVNWLVAPLLMVALAWAFLPDQRDLREGLILVGIARCIAMVLIWTNIAGGDDEYCAILVGINSLLQIVLFAPFAILYINKFVPSGTNGDLDVSYSTVASSVGVFLGIPLAAAIVTRLALRKLLGNDRYQKYFIRIISPLSLIGLLFTIIILFASQGRHVTDEIVAVVRVAAPLVVYFAITFALTLLACRNVMHFNYEVSVAQTFTASSNNFELAIAVAVATYGINSRQALAATVGPLIEIPVLLALVYIFKYLRTRWTWQQSTKEER